MELFLQLFTFDKSSVWGEIRRGDVSTDSKMPFTIRGTLSEVRLVSNSPMKRNDIAAHAAFAQHLRLYDFITVSTWDLIREARDLPRSKIGHERLGATVQSYSKLIVLAASTG